MDETLQDKLKSKRFLLPAMGMTGVFMLVKDTAYIELGCILITIIALLGLLSEFILRYKGKWKNGDSPKEPE